MESTTLLDPQLPALTRHRLITVEPVQFLFSLFYTGSVPLIAQFVESQLEQRYNSTVSDLPCGVAYNDSTTDRIKAEASAWIIYMNVAGMVPSFFITVLLGGYSDATGRKVAFVPPLIGAAMRLLVLIAIVFFNLPLGFLILASLCDGFGGGICAILMASFSYVSSISSSRSRSLRVVVVELCIGLAAVISYLSIGYATHLLGYVWTFVICLAIMFVALCYVVFVLPEVRPVSANPAEKADFFTTQHFRRVLALYLKDDVDGSGRHWKLRFMLLMMGMTSGILIADTSVKTLYMLSTPLCFTAVWIGYYFATSLLSQITAMLIITHIFVRHIGDHTLMVVGLIFGIGDQLMFGLSTNRVMLFLGILAGCACRLPIPLIRAYNSKIVKPDEIGLMFASMAWVENAGILLGLVTQNAIFSATVSWMKNFVFVVNAGSYFLAVLLSMCFIGWLRHKNAPITADRVPCVNGQSASVNEDTDLQQ